MDFHGFFNLVVETMILEGRRVRDMAAWGAVGAANLVVFVEVIDRLDLVLAEGCVD